LAAQYSCVPRHGGWYYRKHEGTEEKLVFQQDYRWALACLVVGVGACALQTETVSGPPGERGPDGLPGKDGATGKVDQAALDGLQAKLDAIQAKFDALQTKVDALGDTECPQGGYVRDKGVTDHIVCKKGQPADEVVKVGNGGSAFWIDRYEAVVIDAATGMPADPGLATFPPSGQWTTATAPVFAQSRKGILPSASFSWFQANEACRAAGKRLPLGDEWLSAARGTPDPGASAGAAGRCNTDSASARVAGGAQTGDATACVSSWGAEDMIGNLGEFGADWYASVGDATTTATPYASFGDGGDLTQNISSMPFGAPMGVRIAGLPAASIRGGYFQSKSGAGIFSLFLHVAPTFGEIWWGFRCLLAR
jgi:formylglycine-generating enzyme required for sulfatase activity